MWQLDLSVKRYFFSRQEDEKKIKIKIKISSCMDSYECGKL